MQSQPVVSQFRQHLLWPVQLVPDQDMPQDQNYWSLMRTQASTSPWREMPDEFAKDNAHLSETRYQEFVSFLPFAQRFLYGEGVHEGLVGEHQRSPIHIFYRHDVRAVRIHLNDQHPELTLQVGYCVLYFFYDIDIAVLAIEISGAQLSMEAVMQLQFTFGRTYPNYWTAQGDAGNCPKSVTWLDKHGAVLAESDYGNKEEYLNFVKNNHAPKVAKHWAYLMQPLVQHYSSQSGQIRYREIEYQRIPMMSFIAVEDTQQLSRGDLVRLGLCTPYGESDSLPFPENFLTDFEQKHCYDRYWDTKQQDTRNTTRFMCSDQGLVVIGSQKQSYFTDENMGTLSQFNNQFFLLFLIAHFQKASLLMISDKLVQAISQLDITQDDSIKHFRITIKKTTETFLRFTHRYWFQEVSEHALTKDLFHMLHQHINSDKLFEKTRRRIMDMQEYLENEELRRQADTVVRLTVVTILGLIGTMTSGLLGMNLIDLTTASVVEKIAYFSAVFIPVTILTFYTVLKSKRLSFFLDAMSDEKIKSTGKIKSLLNVWSNKNLNE